MRRSQAADHFEIATVPTFWVYTKGSKGCPRQWGFWVYLTADSNAKLEQRLVMVHVHCTLPMRAATLALCSPCAGACMIYGVRRHRVVAGTGAAGAGAPRPWKKGDRNTYMLWRGFDPFSADPATGGGVWQLNFRHAYLTGPDNSE